MIDEELVETLKEPKTYKKNDKSNGYREVIRNFKVRVKHGTALYEIFVDGGGVMPERLKSLYTSSAEAIRDVKMYESSRRRYY